MPTSIWKHDPEVDITAQEGRELGVKKAPQYRMDSLYSSANVTSVTKFRRLRWASHLARLEEGKGSFNILTGKPLWKRPLGTPRCRSEDIIRMDLKELGVNTTNSVDSSQDRDCWRAIVNVDLNLRVP